MIRKAYAAPLISSDRIKSLGTINVPKAAFLQLVHIHSHHQNKDQNDDQTLAISSFDPIPFIGKQAVYVIPNISQQLHHIDSIDPIELNHKSLVWPNEVTQAPPSLFNGITGIVVAGGFLVPTFETGGVWYISTQNSLNATPKRILPKDKDWFYHRVRFADMTGDGKLDLVTARAQKGTFSDGKGELVLGVGSLTEGFTPTTLCSGPDIFFEVVDLNKDGKHEIIAAEFFGKRLVVYWTEDPKGDWRNTKEIRSEVIDDECGALFDVSVQVYDGDGALEAIVTNHQEKGDSPPSSLFTYKIPSNFSSAPWPRITLDSSFKVRKSGIHQAAPGAAVPFYPNPKHEKYRKPWLAVSGDGTEKAYIYAPQNPQDPSNWKYEQVWSENYGATVGKPEAADVDGDGMVEIFFPAYEPGLIHVLKLKPEQNLKYNIK